MKNTRRLIEIMAKLRDPVTGCPWDQKQDFASLIPYTLEEAYEVADAVEREDFIDLRDELGDLLLQVAFHARLAEELTLFNFEDVAAAICDKLVRRHPHVFDGLGFDSDEARLIFWENAKIEEKRGKNGQEPEGALADVPASLPALMQAQKLQKRASRFGFDWDGIKPVYAKVEEELAELFEAQQNGEREPIEEEVGDLLFAVVNLSRHLGVDAESALRASNRKFTRRFSYAEQRLKEQNRVMTEASAEELDALWEEAKRTEQ
ncbi:MAG: nucleoside triphosphate pyrophosphohydrolase [Candidatus Methylumidiphilus alinenensis]|uniref:Nucleoside triphosphate pyrophosphohydrolase n=1 Tax=Candidatus Methylumidiphilus alinenensis TaxID=2202197 RepID=A0A2W4SIP9_9GAMM|nr:MAG: nucleoside triphosphate pyrophosphohydrolase [Candidatus Methylumidiphilus alinenensis]